MRKYITFDWAIKSILRNKANFAVLEGFVSVLLGDDIKIVSILESETNKNREMEKMSRVDMLAKDSKGDLILFEVQYVRELDYFHRMLYETSRIITESVGKGESYSEVKKVYSIHIVYFNLGVGDDCVYKGTTSFVGITSNEELRLTKRQQESFKVKTVSDIFPTYYILKLYNYKDDDKSELGEWLKFLKYGDINDETSVRGLVEAKKTLDIMTLPDKEYKRYQWYMENLHYQASMFETAITEGKEDGYDEGYDEGFEEGVETGVKKGVMQEKMENAHKMKEIGMTAEQIAAVTGLEIEDIDKL